jgi:hypothetical protein
MKAILEAIQLQVSDAVPAIQYTDENWGQLDLFGANIPVKWPCVLIDMVGGQYSNIGQISNELPRNRQQGSVNIEITVAALRLTNTSRNAPHNQRYEGFEIWEIVAEVHKHLHGFRPADNTGKLIRTQLQKVRRDDGVQEVRITYSLGVHNC